MKPNDNEQRKNIPYNQERIKQSQNQVDTYYHNALSKITFGKDNNINNIRSSSRKEKEKDIRKINSLNSLINNENKRIYNNDSKTTLKNNQLVFSTIINKIGSHNSYLGVTIHSLYHMPYFRDFIIKDIDDKHMAQYPILTHLKTIFIKYSHNKRIDISDLSIALSEQFAENKMFALDKPDDCSDCLFAFINMIHCFYLKCPLNFKSDKSCNNSCFVHRYYWLNITKTDECECTAINQTHCSIHNYITDIPLDIILQYIQQKGLYESNQKLFNMYHHLIQNTKVLCPLNGLNCNFCSTKRTLTLIQPLPHYFIFSYERLSVSQCSIADILKSLFVIPKYNDFGILFSIDNSNQKAIYELFGLVFIKSNKGYSCAFKYNPDTESNNNTNANINWVYYDDDNVYTLVSFIDLISLCLKNSLFPYLLYYKSMSSNSNKKISHAPYCSMDELRILEKYALTIDNYSMTKARFRPLEALFNKENEIKRNTSHRKIHSHVIRNPNKSKQRVNDEDDELSEYICSNCNSTNRIECILCPNCGESNEKTIEYTIKRRQKVMNLPLARNNNNNIIITQAKAIGIPRSKEVINQNVPINNNDYNITNYNSVISNEVKNINNNGISDSSDQKQVNKRYENKNYDLPKQMNLKKYDTNLSPNNTPSLINYNTNPQIGLNQLDNQIDNTMKIKSNPSRIKEQQMQISPNNQNTQMQLINIDDSSSLILENRIKAYIDTKNKDSNSYTNSNYLTNNNSKEYTIMKPQTAQKPIYLPEMWICANCEKVNKANEFKCLVCGLINKKQRDLIAQHEKHINKSLDAKFTPSSREFNVSNQQQQLTAPSHPINLNTTFKKVSCVCYSNHKSNVIKNGICSVCHRVIESSSSIKKSTYDNDREIAYKYAYAKDIKDNNNSSDILMKMQGMKKSVTAQNRYENEETVTNLTLKNTKVSKDTTMSLGFKKIKSEQTYKRMSQKKK